MPTADLPPPSPVRTARDPLFDNARAVLIVLVVIGHLLAPWTARSSDAFYTWIYSFHMPAFVLVSGYLSRSWTGSGRQARSLVMTLVVPYVIFQVINAVEQTLVLGDPFDVHLLHPAWTLWFLLALLVWRLATPVLRVLRYPVLFAAVVSVVAPLDPGLDDQLSLDRVLGMLPFFVAGLMLTPERVDRLRTRSARITGATVLAVAAVLSVVLAPHFSASIFHMTGSYADTGDNLLAGMLVRAGVVVVGLVGALAVLAVIPRTNAWYTVVGRNSLTVYLVHAPLIYPLRFPPYPDSIPGVAGTLVVVTGGALLALALGSPLAERWTRPLVRPPLERVILRPHDGEGRQG